MQAALELAQKGLGKTSPNPAVGAVVVKDGVIVGRGFHKKAGGPHAEVEALKKAGKEAKGGELYVTLEPCAHHGKTPPCTDTIIKSGVKRVIAGAKDPNPIVSGKGIRKLRKAGLQVSTGILYEQCCSINQAYEKFITTRLPLVTLKLAVTLDGHIATKSGQSRWITSPESRKYVHKIRSHVDCVMVGSGTVKADDPSLTVRDVAGRNPARAVIDSRLSIPLDSKLFSSQGERVFVFTGRYASESIVKKIQAKGAEVIKVRDTKEGLSIKSVLRELGKRDITSVMIEGGSRLSATVLKQGLVDKLLWFVAPVIFGSDGLPAVGELGVKSVAGGFRLQRVKVSEIGEDLLVEGYMER